MDLSLLLDGLSWALLIVGSVFLLIGGLGVLRMPDLYTRMHAASLTDTMAAICILGGLMLQGGLTLVTAKLVLILVFLLLTSPIATHALAAAGLSDGHRPLLARDDGTLAETAVDLPGPEDEADAETAARPAGGQGPEARA